MLGFSVYLGDPFDKTYIETMLNEGAKYVFTSLQIPEDDPMLYLTKLKELNKIVNGRAEIIADANPKTFKTLGLSYKKPTTLDRKSTRLNSSHVSISYAVFCLKKK